MPFNLGEILRLVAVGLAGVFILLLSAMLVPFVVRLVIGATHFTAVVASGFVQYVQDGFDDAVERSAAARRRRYWRAALSRPPRSGRPDRTQIKHVQEAEQIQAAVRLLAETMGACWLVHHLMAEAFSITDMNDLRANNECWSRRQSTAELTALVLGMLERGAASIDPTFIKNALFVHLASGMCGANCHLLEHTRRAAPSPCMPAKLLGYRPETTEGPEHDD